ncbi:MAG TPA: ABC transporter permease [Thermoplasmata archaeon]|jgi:ABC-2 type transport system permease protein
MATVGAFGKGWVVTRLTLRYLLSTRRGIATLALAWVPLLLTGSLALARTPSFDILLFQTLMVPLFLQVVLIFVTLVNATAIIREEIEDNTLPYLLTRPVSKPAIAVSKYAGYLVAVLLLLVPPVILAYLVTEAYAGTALGTDADVLGGFLLATVLGCMAYGALFYFLSVVLRKPLPVGLLIGFVWESIVGSIPGDVPKLSLIFYLRSVLKGMVSVGPLAGFPTNVSAEIAALILVAFSIAMVVLAVVVFQGMEFRQKA